MSNYLLVFRFNNYNYVDYYLIRNSFKNVFRLNYKVIWDWSKVLQLILVSKSKQLLSFGYAHIERLSVYSAVFCSLNDTEKHVPTWLISDRRVGDAKSGGNWICRTSKLKITADAGARRSFKFRRAEPFWFPQNLLLIFRYYLLCW